MYSASCAHPKPKPPKTPDKTHHEPSNAATRGFKWLDKDPVYLGMLLEGKMVPCLLDTGCDATLVPKDLIDAHKSIPVTPTSVHLKAANDTEIEIMGKSPFH